MSRLADVFNRPGHKALIPYVTVGYPSIEATLKIVPLLAECGCDIVELGIPFSDPLADGVTIQNASFQALQNGVTPEICLEVASQLRQKVTIPLVFMTYFNPVFNYGLEKFCRAARNSGIDGLIIPDMPPEEGSELEALTRKQGLDLIYLLAPTSPEERIRMVAEKSRGFIYLVSVTGVTGARSKLPPDLEEFIVKVRQLARQPLCIGFGISTPEQAKRVARLADGVIVGSRLIQLMEAEGDFVSKVRNFVTSLRHALDEIPGKHL
ncbi:MAG: tryptophan synthase subunit alpha [Chloroflexi bacterium]|nr:tryptophan synthase subunit alpha [Chloroflexota bacterium]MBI4268064.1 tryptophan synthase subunit alpha [Chloroflexota bacterium]